MDLSVAKTGDSAVAAMSGKFTFSDHVKFKQVLEAAEDTAVKSVILDFSRIEFIDSAGLGMLMILRKIASEKNTSVSIRSAREQVEKILRLAQFDKMFLMVA